MYGMACIFIIMKNDLLVSSNDLTQVIIYMVIIYMSGTRAVKVIIELYVLTRLKLLIFDLGEDVAKAHGKEVIKRFSDGESSTPAFTPVRCDISGDQG